MNETRIDGLAVSTARDTIRYIAGTHGAALDTGPRSGHLRGWIRPSAVEPLKKALDRHGFEVVTVPDGNQVMIDVDPETCPDTTPEARESLADRLATLAEREARENTDNCNVDAAALDAADNEYRWCMTQTLPALRLRAAASGLTM
jgi:hypothetical protein